MCVRVYVSVHVRACAPAPAPAPVRVRVRACERTCSVRVPSACSMCLGEKYMWKV